MRRVARGAVRVAPAVVVLGGLAAVPQVRGLVVTGSSGTGAAAAHQTSDQIFSDRLVGTSGDSPEMFKTTLYRHHRAKPASSAASAGASSSASPGPTKSSVAAATTLRCSGTSGMLPENYAAIVSFLTAHGYTGLAAAGIAGNIYQESKGNPESVGTGGGGLIGWTPLPAGYVTGNVSADLETQLEALLRYNEQWAQYIPALNAATSAVSAAAIYMDDFERPGIPAAENREGAAAAVAQACGL